MALVAGLLMMGCGSSAAPGSPDLQCESDQFLTEVCSSFACVSAPPECAEAPSCACLIEFGPCDPEDGPCGDPGASVAITLDQDPSACSEDSGGHVVVALATIDGC